MIRTIRTAVPARSASRPDTNQNGGLHTWRILVVDDNADIVHVISRILEREGYEALVAQDGWQALEIARREMPDLILLDWMLPGMDGLDVCRRLKSDSATRGIMIVLVTGRGSVNNRIEGFDAGADDFIPKPFNHPELLARVRSALRIKRLTNELSERNRQLLQSQHELVRTEKMATIGLLAAGIAHEFNNIMAGISGYAQLARKDPKYLPQLVEVALTQADRAEELTKSLSSYHRQGTQETSCDMRDVVQRALCLVKKELESNGIQLEADLRAVAPAAITPGQLQEIVLNMLINAIHAVGRNGTIGIRVSHGTSPRELRLEVRDTGGGISEENLGKIFDPFFTTKGALGGGKQTGTGLGLSICYNIVQACGGRIAVESEVGRGTTFTVTLPVADRSPGAARDEESSGTLPAPTAPLPPLRILIVDDEGPIRSMLEEFLCEHDVTSCATGVEALEEYRRKPFDFVLLDICMRDSPNGLETLKRIKDHDPDARVILVSGRLPDGVPDEMLHLAHGHLLKPFKFEALESLLETVRAT